MCFMFLRTFFLKLLFFSKRVSTNDGYRFFFETNWVASILGCSGRKKFRYAYSLTQHPATCGLSLSMESGCGKRMDASNFLRPSSRLFGLILKNIHEDNLSLSEMSDLKIHLSHGYVKIDSIVANPPPRGNGSSRP